MTIQVEKTADDQTYRFITSVAISAQDKTYSEADQATASPVAHKIFGFPWTAQVRVGQNFVEITKQDWVDWAVLEEPLLGLLTEHFSGRENIEENPQPVAKKEKQLDSPEAQIIQKLIEEQINPALSSHGGYVVLHSVEEGTVFLEMGGGCQGCAMSYQTLKEGIEGAIIQTVPSIKTVVDVTNHEMGQNPFY